MIILADGRVTIKGISLKFGSGVGTIYKIIHDDLNFRKTRARCVPPKCWLQCITKIA